MNITRILEEKLSEALRTGKRVFVPEAGILVWQWFMELSEARTWHAHGPNPIGYSEIETYGLMMHWQFEARHIEAIRALDNVFLDYCRNRSRPPPPGTKAAPRISQRPLTGELLDAMFGR